jgi:hypothetical protein
MRNWKFVWSRGTGYGWVLGHPADPASTMCERWSALSSRCELPRNRGRRSSEIHLPRTRVNKP